MNLFVDANILLDFYHFSSDDLEELEKLVDLINKKEVTLVVTRQIIHEVKRNRDNKVADAYKKFKDSKIAINLPQICKVYSDEFTQIEESVSMIKRALSELDKKVLKDINERTLKADELISKLFEVAKTVESNKYVEQARLRFDLGDPPGKNKSYGDSINWESLLAEIDDGEDLFLISEDEDYKSRLDDEVINSFLAEEWTFRKRSKIYFYTRLSKFFEEHHNYIQLKVEEEKDKLIELLSNSPSFSYTHRIIAGLSSYVSFTDAQIQKLFEIAKDNLQVFSILDDSDIREFYEKLINNKEDFVDKETLKRVMERIRLFDNGKNSSLIESHASTEKDERGISWCSSCEIAVFTTPCSICGRETMKL